jgi:hypothetical protein
MNIKAAFHYCLFLSFIFYFKVSFGQVIVHSTDVELTKRLSVDGKIKVGDDASNPAAGSMRFNSSNGDFEGYNGSEWVSLTKVYKTWGGDSFTDESDKITSSNGSAGDNFGWSVEIDGDYAVVGAPNYDVGASLSVGRAYVYKKNGENWIEEAILTPNINQAFLLFGVSVDIWGSYIIVGGNGYGTSNGAAYIYHRTGNTWPLEQLLGPADSQANAEFGRSVSISGSYAVVGAPFHDVGGNQNQGKAYVFERTANVWNESQSFSSGGDASDYFGSAVAIDGDYVAIGAPNFDSNNLSNSGSVAIYSRANFLSPFTLQTALTASDVTIGDNFGVSVEIDDNNIIIGTFPGNISRGRAYIFTRFSTSWIQTALLLPSDPDDENWFGYSVDISGNYAVVGAMRADFPNLLDRGKVYVYGKNSSTTWVQQARLSASDSEAADQLGSDVAISGEDIIAGAWQANPNSNANKGRVYFYK